MQQMLFPLQIDAFLDIMGLSPLDIVERSSLEMIENFVGRNRKERIICSYESKK